uniref:Uncharacterized protein n=1 Tax=Pyxicephalus adspersus TaxID=30357 RepID=A0AAV2ZWJ4_PYXAD|nr:TPA: hypothetical protein GDO54_003861 [Pyxicephalus adspersus]
MRISGGLLQYIYFLISLFHKNKMRNKRSDGCRIILFIQYVCLCVFCFLPKHLAILFSGSWRSAPEDLGKLHVFLLQSNKR